MTLEPEPIERVRALVCEPCWVDCFDTEGFEKLGRGDVDKFEYKVGVPYILVDKSHCLSRIAIATFNHGGILSNKC